MRKQRVEYMRARDAAWDRFEVDHRAAMHRCVTGERTYPEACADAQPTFDAFDDAKGTAFRALGRWDRFVLLAKQSVGFANKLRANEVVR